MKPFFSIITPTLQRESLNRCCASVDAQSFGQWEHIVIADAAQEDYRVWDWWKIRDDKRLIMRSPRATRQWGNLQRHLAWEWAAGDYLIYLDDDNVMFHPGALQEIHDALEEYSFPEWAIFPIHRHGSPFLLIPPGMCRTDSANIVVKREIGRWPNIEVREADGVLAEHLNANYPHAELPGCQPIILMEKSSNGV